MSKSEHLHQDHQHFSRLQIVKPIKRARIPKIVNCHNSQLRF